MNGKNQFYSLVEHYEHAAVDGETKAETMTGQKAGYYYGIESVININGLSCNHGIFWKDNGFIEETIIEKHLHVNV